MADIKDIIEDVILKEVKQPLWESWYIKEKIGSGAFSIVYRTEAQRGSRTDVSALKIEVVTTDDQVMLDEKRKETILYEKQRSVENETQIMLGLRDCPNIVKYEDEYYNKLYVDGQFEGYYYIIRMEYLNPITKLMRNGTFDYGEDNVRRIARDIGNALKAAHDNGIIHRDIKPGNFFVSDNGTYKLGDFNISKKAKSTRSFAGTDYYMAPEVFRAKSDVDVSYTAQADIYSLGICLYQLLNNGLLPFEDTMSTEDAIDRRLSGEALPHPVNASADMASIILKACEYDTERRYKTADELISDLRHGFGAFETEDVPVARMEANTVKTSAVHVVKRPSKPKMTVILLATLLLLSIGICISLNAYTKSTLVSAASAWADAMCDGDVDKVLKFSSASIRRDSDEIEEMMDFTNQDVAGNNTSQIFNYLLTTTSYTIDRSTVDIDLMGTEGSVVVVFSIADYERTLNDPRYQTSAGTMISQLTTITDTEEYRVKLKLIRENGEWVVNNTGDIVDEAIPFLNRRVNIVSPLAEGIGSVSWRGGDSGSSTYTEATYIELHMDIEDWFRDWSNVYYEVRYDGRVVYTSDRGDHSGLFDGNGGTYRYGGDPMNPGRYTITFFDENGAVIAGSTCTVVNP